MKRVECDHHFHFMMTLEAHDTCAEKENERHYFRCCKCAGQAWSYERNPDFYYLGRRVTA